MEAASVSGHDLDLRMIPKPASRGSSRSVLKDIDDLTPFEVDNNCSEVVSLPGGPNVDAHHANRDGVVDSRPPAASDGARSCRALQVTPTLRSSLSPGKPPTAW